ncbi:MAG: alpha/beta hydrolase [Acidimicrobiales bacterium]|jgi:acetyl esterase/lipase|nr:alpha/beta hydrolase [Acidimicrobiales bacterium]
MVMGARPAVATAGPAITAVDAMGLAQQMANALLRVPFRRPWEGPGGLPTNVAAAITREAVRAFMGYSSSLPIEEFRSIERLLDDLCRVVMPPIVAALDVDARPATLGGVRGTWYRPRGVDPVGAVLYLHGGGYIGTSPSMYAFFTAALAAETRCEVFVADYRLAPEYPFPADVEDAVSVVNTLHEVGVPHGRLLVAGDSGGGGLANTLVLSLPYTDLPNPAGLLLFSPEVDLRLDEPSVTDNARSDILPWNIPTSSYLHGFDPASGFVSPVNADLTGHPPTFVAWGDREMFRDPIRRFVVRLREADVDHTALEEPGMFHVFPILMPWADQSRRVYRSVAAFVDALVADHPTYDSAADRTAPTSDDG